MSTSSRLTKVFNSSIEIPFDNSSRIILMSDCHRSDNSWADDFANNQNLFFNALQHYYENGFTYIELGDSDELWENKKFSDIRETYSHIFWLMQKFYTANRLYMLWGNHDMVKKNPSYVAKNLYSYYDEREKLSKPLFKGIKVHEGLILKHLDTGNKIFLVHGHQGDLINDALWRLGRFLVRYIWRYLELLGANDPTSPAKNYGRKTIVENKIAGWAKDNKQMTISGHTHRPIFPNSGEIPYFNSGSCVHPRCITGIEIANGEISLIKWSTKTKFDGTLYVGKDIISGPASLNTYLGSSMSNADLVK